MRHARQIAAVCALLLGAAGGARAQGFALEGAVIDSRNSQNLGVVTERGDISALFKAQKAMTFGILRSAGISLEQLPPEVRSRIERYQTTNVEAFRAFSQGLDLKDQGKFVEAKEFFRRAAELDPGFALAAEQQQAMPDVNLGNSVQARAVMLAAAGAAVDRGKASFTVDLARAVAAIAAGQTVILTTVAATTEQAQSANSGYTTNPPGSGAQYAPNLAAALTFPIITTSNIAVNLASASEWRADSYQVSGGVLDSLGSLAQGFYAQRAGAATGNTGSLVLADGSTAYWGSWLSTPTASAAVTVGGSAAVVAPQLGNVDYVFANATRQMPSTGTATYTPAGGSLGSASGSIAVSFVNRSVALQNLGFTIGSLVFSGLNGLSTFSATSASGAFGGNYSSGSCSGCAAFTPGASSYNGNFAGRNADGLVFSTFLNTGGINNVAGVHLFSH